MNKGYSLIEMLIAVVIITTLAVGATESIVAFQYQSQVESATTELLSTLREAQSRSRSGLIPSGMTAASFAPTGLPVYSLQMNGSSYSLHRTGILNDGSANVADENHVIDPSITVTPISAMISFDRITGLPSTTQTFTLSKGSNTTTQTILVTSSGIIIKN